MPLPLIQYTIGDRHTSSGDDQFICVVPTVVTWMMYKGFGKSFVCVC